MRTLQAASFLTSLALFVACSAAPDQAEESVSSQAVGGCEDGVEEYIDTITGEMVICVHTTTPGGSGGGSPPPMDPCWQFPWLCQSGPSEPPPSPCEIDPTLCGGGEEPPPVPPEACTPAGDDCGTAQRCCGSNVCAFGGERDEPWCQPLSHTHWDGYCVSAIAGSPVYFNGAVVTHTQGGGAPSNCLQVQKDRCVIGWTGDWGDGTYTMRIRDLVQLHPGTCGSSAK